MTKRKKNSLPSYPRMILGVLVEADMVVGFSRRGIVVDFCEREKKKKKGKKKMKERNSIFSCFYNIQRGLYRACCCYYCCCRCVLSCSTFRCLFRGASKPKPRPTIADCVFFSHQFV